MRRAGVGLCLVAAVSATSWCGAPAPLPAREDQGDLVQLTFPENFDVRLLADYVSKRLGINIVYAPEVLANKRISIVSPAKLPKDSLLVLLESVLRMSGLALVDGEKPGWKSILPTQALLSATEKIEKDPRRLAEAPGTTLLTQVFDLRHVQAANAEKVIRPFLTKVGGNAFPVPNTNLLIVSDYVSVLRQVASLLEVLDQAGAGVSVRFVAVKCLPAADLAAQVNTLLQEKDKVAFAGSTPPPRPLAVSADSRTNQLIIMTRQAEAAEVMDLVAKLDVPEPPPGESNVRFYKLLNTTADSVLETLRALELEEKGEEELPREGGPSETPAAEREQPAPGTLLPTGRRQPMTLAERFVGPNQPPPPPGSTELPKPPAYNPGKEAAAARTPKGHATVKGRGVTITADPNTNSIIIIAGPAVQRTYRELITALDKRRPQVMVEVFLVTLDDTDARSLAVEMSNADSDGKRFVFSSLFGLNKVDAATGQITPAYGSGLQGGMVGPDTFNFLLNALASRSRTKVVSAPRLLVNDNATATLSSQAEAPFTSVNASDTVATTSFGGYVGAGTTITVTPHISEGDHLQLRYSVSLNSFGEGGTAGIPPPRQTNEVNSEVTVPDSYAIIVGGLTTDHVSETVTKVPILGEVDSWIRHLFRSTSNSGSRIHFYVFIRPIILRDDLFADLKYLSDRDLAAAAQPPNFPAGEPLTLP